jgi:hypothetical protein
MHESAGADAASRAGIAGYRAAIGLGAALCGSQGTMIICRCVAVFKAGYRVHSDEWSRQL